MGTLKVRALMIGVAVAGLVGAMNDLANANELGSLRTIRERAVAVGHESDPNLVFRVSGADRIETGIVVSQGGWDDDSALAVVLSRSDGFADAMAGTPLAVAKGGPLLLNPPDALDPRVLVEIDRLLAPGSTVYLLGGASALSPAVETALTAAGYVVVRYSGATRFDTAIQVADVGLGNPDLLLLTNGLDFPDALPAGTAAGANGGAVLLTSGPTMPTSLQAYLDAHPTAITFAIGGPAASAAPAATPVIGTTRFHTSALVADLFFDAPFGVGLASGLNYPDALTGGTDAAWGGVPLLLTPADALDPSVEAYIDTNHDSVDIALVYGGVAAVKDSVLGILLFTIT